METHHGNYGNKMIKDFWKDKKVLITGHTGFKGSWLTLWLKTLGPKVCGISLEPNNLSLFNQLDLEKQIDSHFVENINNSTSINKIVNDFNPDIVFHLAAQPLVIESYKNPIQTWETNVMGSLKILEAIKNLKKKCSAIFITTDKVYENNEWEFGYRENDPLGGYDPYSASKASAEIAINSWRNSFCGNKTNQTNYLGIATARSGNVIGGGDYSENRLVPDLIKSLNSNTPIVVRNPNSTRPWQHVLEPLSGYLDLARLIYQDPNNLEYCEAFNFGPEIKSNKTVRDLLAEIFKHCDGKFIVNDDEPKYHEASNLRLQIDKSFHRLGWYPKWDFSETIKRTINWYSDTNNKLLSPLEACLRDINEFNSN